jgi:hypothetical protein
VHCVLRHWRGHAAIEQVHGVYTGQAPVWTRVHHGPQGPAARVAGRRACRTDSDPTDSGLGVA